MTDREEYEFRKKAIFDGMSKRGQERILRLGYENWDPFEAPKDPRDRIFSSASVKAGALIQEYYKASGEKTESVSVHKELLEICRGFFQGDSRAKAIVDFCAWLRNKTGQG
jgi:broad specificity phosphatase PhoE